MDKEKLDKKEERVLARPLQQTPNDDGTKEKVGDDIDNASQLSSTSSDGDEYEAMLSYQPFSPSTPSTPSTPSNPRGRLIEKDKENVNLMTEEMAREKEKEIGAAARRKADLAVIPQNISSPLQLFWRKEKSRYLPCRLCDLDESIGLALPKSWNPDDPTKCLVQDIDGLSMGEYLVVSKSSLIPYHGLKAEDVSHKTNEEGWCADKCMQLEKNCHRRALKRLPRSLNGKKEDYGEDSRSMQDAKIEAQASILFLECLLKTAKRRDPEWANVVRQEKEVDEAQPVHVESGCSRMEGPASYVGTRVAKDFDGTIHFGTVFLYDVEEGKGYWHVRYDDGDEEHFDLQDLNLAVDIYKKNIANDQQLNVVENDTTNNLNGTKKEPLRSGDTITYFSPAYVAGDDRGFRSAQIISVNPRNDPVLILDNAECLPRDTKVKRIRMLVRGKVKDNPDCIYKDISQYQLRQTVTSESEGEKLGFMSGIRKESHRLGQIVEKHLAVFDSKVKTDGFAPMDVMHKFPRNSNKRVTPQKKKKGQRSLAHSSPSTRGKTAGSKSTPKKQPKTPRTPKSTPRKPPIAVKRKESSAKMEKASISSEAAQNTSTKHTPTKRAKIEAGN